MDLNWEPSESAVIPAEVDLDSSPTAVYFRRNIHTEQRDKDDGTTYTVYAYDEATMPKSEYASHQAYTNQANIDFIAMMTDVELGG